MAGPPGLNTEYVAWVAPTSPIGTPATSPTITAVGTPQAWVWSVQVRIPPGHAGLTGIALVDSGSFLLPFAQPGPAWLIGDDDLLTYPLDHETGDHLALWSYNTSTDYKHGWQVRITYTPIAVFSAQTAEIVVPEVEGWLAAPELAVSGP